MTTEKDFRYYADKAEETLNGAVRNAGRFSDEQVANEIAKAQVFATLAAGAPIAPVRPCPGRLYGIGGMVPAPARPCTLPAGHTGDHVTEDGVRFHGDWPMRDDD